MKLKALILYIFAAATTMGAWAQDGLDTGRVVESPIDVPYRIGLRGGLNLADMVYTNPAPAMLHYGHTLQPHGIGSVFVCLGFEGTGLAIAPEVGVVGKGVKLNWDDVDYRMRVNYLDFRMPITYNFRLKGKPALSPYVMVAPDFGAAFGGDISYAAERYTATTDYRYTASTDITIADVNRFDFGVMFGAGVDYLLNTKSIPLVLSLEAGWNMGLTNTFAERENLDARGNEPPQASNIINRFFGAELWHNERYSRGIEVAARISVPLTGYKQENEEPIVEVYMAPPPPPEPEPEPEVDTTPERKLDTVMVHGFNYVKKDCYSLYEMLTFINEGVDISDKRICIFNINFDFDSDKLRPESEEPLNEVLELMKTFPEISIQVYGHTDSIGTAKYNQGLSERRAASAARYLIEHGIDPERIFSIGFSFYLPIDTNETEEGRFHNRRVEFEILNVEVENIDRNRMQQNQENNESNE